MLFPACSWSYYADRPMELVPGATSHGMYTILLGRYKHIAKRAAYTFKTKYAGNVSRKSEFLAELKADLIVLTDSILYAVFMDAIGSTVVEQIKKPGMKLLDPAGGHQVYPCPWPRRVPQPREHA